MIISAKEFCRSGGSTIHGKIDLNALLLLDEVVSSGSLTRASTRTGLSIATISRRLALLEEQVGAALLRRSSRSLAPTAVGTRLVQHGRRIGAEAEAALAYAADAQTELRGPLRVSLPSELGQAWLGRAVASFAVAFPNVTLEIGTYDGVVDLIRDPCDVAVLLRAPPDSRLIRKRLTTLRRGIYAAPSYLEHHGLPETLEGLSLHRCIVTELQREERVWTFSRQRRRRSVETQWRAVVSSIGMLRELVLGGAGIGMLNEILCRNDIRAGRLVRVLPDWDGPPLHATAVLPSRHLVPRRSRVFLDFISRELGRGEGRGS